MDISIISSLKDPASVNIKDNLINNFEFKQLEEKFDDNNIYQLNLNNNKSNNENINNDFNEENKIKKLSNSIDNNNIKNKNNQINNKINLTSKKNNEKNSIKKINKNLINHNDIIKNNKIIKLYTINSELIYSDDLDKKINADIFVFISKHRAEEGRASLTCHAIGNFGKAEHGGKEKTICKSPSFLLKNIFIQLNKSINGSEYEATLEATHHGPFMEKPLLFVELGSNEKFWNDKNGGKLIAISLINALEKSNLNLNNDNSIINNHLKNEKINSINKKRINKKLNKENVFNNNELNNNSFNNEKNKNSINGNNKLNNNENYESTLVIGGSHYSHVGNKAMLQSDIAVGHICPKYNFANLNEGMLKQTMEKIIPKPKFVLLDWKGLGKEKQRILAMLKKNDIGYERSDKFF